MYVHPALSREIGPETHSGSCEPKYLYDPVYLCAACAYLTVAELN